MTQKYKATYVGPRCWVQDQRRAALACQDLWVPVFRSRTHKYKATYFGPSHWYWYQWFVDLEFWGCVVWDKISGQEDRAAWRGGSCLTALVDPLVATELGFLVLGCLGFNRYLLVCKIWSPPPPPKLFHSMGSPLGVKFSACEGAQSHRVWQEGYLIYLLPSQVQSYVEKVILKFQ